MQVSGTAFESPRKASAIVEAISKLLWGECKNLASDFFPLPTFFADNFFERRGN